jgi:hypothetical protein
LTSRSLRSRAADLLGVAWPAFAAALTSLAVYVPTLMPDIGFWDTAEFQAIGPVLGIAHPTGYPSYTLLAWLASVLLQPLGTEAFRANLLNALLMASAAGLLALAVTLLTRRRSLALAAGLLLGPTPCAPMLTRSTWRWWRCWWSCCWSGPTGSGAAMPEQAAGWWFRPSSMAWPWAITL